MVEAKDFVGSESDSQIFVAYVKASLLLGDTSSMCLQTSLSEPELERLRNALLWWTKEVPPDAYHMSFTMVRMPTAENFATRQLFLLYLATINLLYRKWRVSASPRGVPLAASSLIAGLLETFLARDECRHLAVTLCFYAVVAAIPLVEALSIPSLRDDAAEDLANVRLFLETMSKKWPSALSGLKMIQKHQYSTRCSSIDSGGDPVPYINMQDRNLFEGHDVDNCRLWHRLTSPVGNGLSSSLGNGPAMSHVLPFANMSSAIDSSTYLSESHGLMSTDSRDDMWSVHFGSGTGENGYLGEWLASDDFFGSVLS